MSKWKLEFHLQHFLIFLCCTASAPASLDQNFKHMQASCMTCNACANATDTTSGLSE